MIETGHGRDDIRRVPVYSLYSETREPTADMLRDLDVLVVDLQDVGTRIYTYIYTMANCLIAARRHGVKVIVCDRPNPIGGVAVEGPMLEPRVRVVRRPVSDSDAARDDDRRAGAAVQRALRHRRGSRGRDDGGLAPATCISDETGLPWVLPSPNIPTRRQRGRVSGHRAVRRNERLGGAGHDAPVRAGGRAVGRRRAIRRRDESAAAAGRALPAGGLRADLPQAREDQLRRLPDSRARSTAVPGGRNRRRADRRVPRRPTRAASNGAQPPYEYEHEKLPIDILAGSADLREQIEAGVPAQEDRALVGDRGRPVR